MEMASVRGLEVLKQGLEAVGDLGVPRGPGVSARYGVEFRGEMEGASALGESLVGFEERLILSDGEIEVGRAPGISGLDQLEGVTGEAGLASRGAEDAAESPPLADLAEGEAATGDIECAAE